MVEAGLADTLNPTLDRSQRQSLKVLSSLRAAITPSASLWPAILSLSATKVVQAALSKLHGSIKLAERAVRKRDEARLAAQAESIRSELASLLKFLRAAQSLSAHAVLSEYAGSVSLGLRNLRLLAA